MKKSNRYRCWFIQYYKGRGFAIPHFFNNFYEQTMRELINAGNIFTSEQECLDAIKECELLRKTKIKDKIFYYENFEVIND